MKRRNFVQIAALSSGIPLFGFNSFNKDHAHKSIHKVPQGPAFELDEKSVADLQSAMKSGQYTSRSICELYLKRIGEIDQTEGGINAVIEINPDALSIADASDKEREAGTIRGPLHGIPIMVKDNINTGDKMMTTAGALALVGNIANKDAFIIKKMREAGAVLLGKTNLSEWANFRSTRSSSGWSGRGRQTRNPNSLDRSPCGSSAGSGAAVSSNLCAITIGTETNGSIVCPSSANGIVGIKPTVGLWSRSGIIPISETQDTAGPMARTVTDAAVLLGALSGTDIDDKRTKSSDSKGHSDYTQFLKKDGLKGKRIGILRSSFGFHEKVDKVMESALSILKKEGAILIDPVEIKTEGKYGNSGFQVLLYEFKDGVNKYLKSANANVKSLAEVIKFNKNNHEESMAYFEQEILEMAEKKGDLTTKEYTKALEKILSLSRKKGIDATLEEHNLGAIIAPTGGPAWPIDLINGDHFGGGSSSPAARAGYPNITVPAGYVFGLPVGISMFSTAFKEPELISMAYAFEQASKHRIAPAMVSSLNFE
ncbi:MAG: amidase [Cyclobacteriaceae bacterium]|nr:amidase [Cyclobacteriaceae bacterium]